MRWLHALKSYRLYSNANLVKMSPVCTSLLYEITVELHVDYLGPEELIRLVVLVRVLESKGSAVGLNPESSWLKCP